MGALGLRVKLIIPVQVRIHILALNNTNFKDMKAKPATLKTREQIISEAKNLEKGSIFEITTPKTKYMIGRSYVGNYWLLGTFISVEWLFYPNSHSRTKYTKKEVFAKLEEWLSQY